MQPQRDPPTLDEVTGFRRRFLPLLELGRGGMARVFLAESITSGIRKLVVLKVLNRELSLDPAMRAAFQREAEVSARMNHPNVVQVFEVVEQAGQPVIVMEYLDGLTLSRVLKKSALPLGLHLDILSQVLAGLHHFHELRDLDQSPLHAVHRDISPQNVLVLHDGIAKVLDFGIAKIDAAGHDQTRTGLVKGKIHYMPPEQLLGETAVDRRADVFAVGVMMWEALAGRRMWEGLTEPKVLRALARSELPKLRDAVPNVPAELEAIVERALAPDREDRFSTAHEMQNELEHAISVTTGVVHPRELAAFMHHNFGEYRELQKKTLDEARRRPTRENGVLEYATPSVFPAEPTTSVLTDVDYPKHIQSQPPPRSGRAQRWVLISMLVLAVCATGLVWKQRVTARDAASASKQALKQVRIQVLTEPADAEIFLNGKRLARGSYKGMHSASSEAHRLETRATGYQTRDEWVNLDEDLIRLIRLERLPTGAASSALVPRRERRPGKATEASSGEVLDASESEAEALSETGTAETSAVDHEEVRAPAALRSEHPIASTTLEVSEPAAPNATKTETVAPAPAASVLVPVPPPTSPGSAPSAASIVSEPKPERPRRVGSKTGHTRLAIDMSQDPYRVRLPAALERTRRTFDTTVDICVAKDGSVSSVRVVRSADRALDRQLSNTLSRWRYRPLLLGGTPVPFCYNLRFELAGG